MSELDSMRQSCLYWARFPLTLFNWLGYACRNYDGNLAKPSLKLGPIELLFPLFYMDAITHPYPNADADFVAYVFE